MAKVLEESWEEHVVRCKRCGKRIAFTVEDVILSTYMRGLDETAREGESRGWIDQDRLWHYIECPNCDKFIDVTGCLSEEEDNFLKHAYNNR